MTTVKTLIDKCAFVLKDPTFDRWTKPRLISYTDEAQKELARLPGAYVKTTNVNLVKGTKQHLPEDAYMLVSVTRNWDKDEDGPLQPVRPISKGLLNSFDPFWHMERQLPYVENYTYDPQIKDEFWVYPPNDGTGVVEVQYSAVPKTLENEDDEIVLPQQYELPMILYVLYRAYMTDSDYSGGLSLANSYYQLYINMGKAASADAAPPEPVPAAPAAPAAPQGA